jgi:hypothetical protein
MDRRDGWFQEVKKLGPFLLFTLGKNLLYNHETSCAVNDQIIKVDEAEFSEHIPQNHN